MSAYPVGGHEAALLTARAERLRRRTEADDTDEGAWAAEFRLGEERYALPLERLRGCLPMKALSPVPLARPGVVGITRWEGKVVAVFSLAGLLGLKGRRRDPAVLLFVSTGRSVVGLDCEEIPRTVLLPLRAPDSAPATTGAVRPLSIQAPGQAAPRLLQWLDPELLLEARTPP
jgi:purine-binding chemotaxis protein CheW